MEDEGAGLSGARVYLRARFSTAHHEGRKSIK